MIVQGEQSMASAAKPSPVEVIISNQVIQQLRVWSGEQDCIIAAYVTREHFDPFITTNVVVSTSSATTAAGSFMAMILA
jgi:hypothetical protein